MDTILEKSFWDNKVPTLRELKNLGFQTSDTRFALLDNIHRTANMWEVRRLFIGKYGFAVPSRQMLEGVARLSKRIVEVGAGTGFMATQLRRFEIDVVATDLNATGTSMYSFSVGSHDANVAPMETLCAVDAVRKYPDRDVFCSWPSLNEPWLTEAADAMQPGRLLFYVGEGYGGCTADDSFHELVQSPAFEEVEYIPMAQFFGINDNLTVYRRLAPAKPPLLTA
jgi:hypothetical protein